MDDEVDRDAATKDKEDLKTTVDRDCATVDSEHANGITDRDKETVSSPPKIIFCIVEPSTNQSALLKGIPSEPLCQTFDQQILFGRGRAAQVFLNDDTASREHMTLFMQTNPATSENMFVVSNVSGTKPVLINGIAMCKGAGTRVLKNNDRLRIGQLEFIVTIIPGDSLKFYQVEFTKGSKGNLQQPNLRQFNNPQIQGGVQVNAQPIFLANNPGAVILPNNFGVPVNPVFNMNLSASGGATQLLNPTGATFQGTPTAPAFQLMPVNPGLGQVSFQQFSVHQGIQKDIPSFQPQQESHYPQVNYPMMGQQESIPAEERRKNFQAKIPSEQNEDPKQAGQDVDFHMSIQETGLQKETKN